MGRARPPSGFGVKDAPSKGDCADDAGVNVGVLSGFSGVAVGGHPSPIKGQLREGMPNAMEGSRRRVYLEIEAFQGVRVLGETADGCLRDD